MPYITESNTKKIFQQIDMEEIGYKSSDSFYKKRLWLLSHKENQWLYGAKKLFGQQEEFFNSMYIKQYSIDTKRYIYEGLLPAYHADIECKRLKSIYENFKIPEEIIARGDKEIEMFRKWFKENRNLFEEDKRRFLTELYETFLIENLPDKVSNPNSGTTIFENIDASTLEAEIDQLMEQAERFYFQSILHQNTIDLKGDLSYTIAKKANKDSIIYIWHHSYKKILQEKLLAYFRVKLNPELEFSKKLLDMLNFRQCQHCCK